MVYNLSVDEAETYYANGVLVHNCTTLALMRFRQGGFITLKTDEAPEATQWRRTVSYY